MTSPYVELTEERLRKAVEALREEVPYFSSEFWLGFKKGWDAGAEAECMDLFRAARNETGHPSLASLITE